MGASPQSWDIKIVGSVPVDDIETIQYGGDRAEDGDAPSLSFGTWGRHPSRRGGRC